MLVERVLMNQLLCCMHRSHRQSIQVPTAAKSRKVLERSRISRQYPATMLLLEMIAGTYRMRTEMIENDEAPGLCQFFCLICYRYLLHEVYHTGFCPSSCSIDLAVMAGVHWVVSFSSRTL